MCFPCPSLGTKTVIEGHIRSLGAQGRWVPLAGRDGEGLPKGRCLIWASASCTKGWRGRGVQAEGPKDTAMVKKP